MRVPSRGVQPTVWLLDNTLSTALPSRLPDVLRRVQVLKLPASILQSIGSLEPAIPKLPPFASLHDTLGTFSREITAFEPLTEHRKSQHWLYARQGSNLHLGHLRTLLQAWLIASYGEQRAAPIIRSWGTLDWVWENIDLQTADLKTKQMLLPGLVSRWLLDEGFSLTLASDGGDVICPLRLVPLMTQRYRAELITEPKKEEDELFSFVLRFWVEPMPGALCLHHRISLRRWMHLPLINGTWVNLKYRRGKSVYLRRTIGYLDTDDDEKSQTYDDVFSRITMKYLGGGVDGLQWVGNQARVFGQLGLDNAPPPIRALAENPQAYYERALITVETRDSESHEIKTGLQVADHKRVFSDLNQRLKTWATTMPVWNRVASGDASGEQSASQRQKVNDEERFEALCAMPSPVRIEIHAHDTRIIKEALLHELGTFNDYQHQLDDKSFCIMNGNDPIMEIVEQQDEHLTDLLADTATQGNEGKRRAIQQRQSEIARRYRYPEIPTGALVALHPYHKAQKRDTQQRDPKSAIRYGLAQAGRLSQFLVPKGAYPRESEDGYPRRVENAVRDLLHVLGYRYNPFYTRIGSLPEHVDIVAFWLIQLNARHRAEQTVILPLVVDAPFGTRHLRMFVPRDTGSAELYPTLREGMLAAAAFEADFSEKEVTGFFRDALDLRHSQAPTLLLLCDQNLRRVFPELNEQNSTNPNVSLNNILTKDSRNIRVGRLRFSSDGEAPFSVPDTEMGKYRGLYAHDTFPNVYLSLQNIGDRPASAFWNKLNWLTKASVNPSTVQIWLNNLQSGDDPAEWAALIHRLRRESSHTNIPTVLPQPLHDVQNVKDYLSRLVDEDVEEDLNALNVTERE